MTTQQEQSPRTDDGAGTGGARTRHVVVGYDGSPASVEALTWAAVEAGSTGARLSVLYAGDVWDDGFSEGFLAAAAESGRRLAREGVDWVHQILGGFDDSRVDAVAVEDGPVTALLAASEHADLVVVGNRGRGRVAGALLGSVAFSITSRARCPVVVVRGEVERRPGPGAPVVVGVDGSHGADDAVLFAAEAAQRWGARLVVVVTWAAPDMAAVGGYGALRVPPVNGWAEKSATIDADVAADLARSRHPGLEVVTRVVQDRPATALAQASDEAGLVVVGARGRGGLASLFLGSVSHATVHEASCPVAVVRRADAP